MPTGAIITGDIVNSTELSPMQNRKLIRLLISESEASKFEFYRGDSFQSYIKDPSQALRDVLKARSVARSFASFCDIRASIGIGLIKTPLRSLKTSTSEAFVLSGRGFDTLTSNANLKIQSSNEQANIVFRVIANYCDYIFSKLTPKQAAVVHELLLKSTQTKAAIKLRITQATVNKHAQSAGWAQVEKLLEEYQQAINQFNLL